MAHYRFDLTRADLIRIGFGSMFLLGATLSVGFLVGYGKALNQGDGSAMTASAVEVLSSGVPEASSTIEGTATEALPDSVSLLPLHAEPGAAPSPQVIPGGFALQAGAFGRAENAEALRRDLRTRGYASVTRSVTATGGTVLVAVDLGYFALEADADAWARDFTRREALPLAVVPVGPRS
jgi:hypothetical protein